jgi:hypothetical protein
LASAILGEAGSLTLANDSAANGGVFYYSHNVVSMNVSAFNGPATTMVYDTTAAQSPIILTCAGNTFYTLYCGDSIGEAISTPTGGEIYGGVNTTTGVYLNGQQYISSQPFTPTGGTSSTTLPNFGDRALSLLDFSTAPTSDCSTNNTSALAAAETAALAQGVHVIRLDAVGSANCYLFGTHTVPTGILLYCPGPQPAKPSTVDYRALPQRVGITGTSGITLSSGAGMDGCLVLPQNLAQAAPPATFQDNYTRWTNFLGKGVTCGGDDCLVENTMAVGFTTALTVAGARSADIHDVFLDGNTCLSASNQGGGPGMNISTINCEAYATVVAGQSTLWEPSFAVSSFADNGSGVLRATLTAPCVGTGCLLTGYNVWVNSPGNSATQSAQGKWTATVVDSTHIDLSGSSSAFIAGQTETGVTVTAGSQVLSGLTTNLGQIQRTQSVTGTCIPAGATVAAVSKGTYGVIWLDAAHLPTCSSSPTETITITDNSASPIAVSSVAVGNNCGSGYVAGDIVSLTTGTGTAATFSIDQVDDGTGSCGNVGGVLAISLIDGGSYSVAPSTTNVPVTGGAGSSLTVNVSVGASLYGSALYRSGPGYNIAKMTDMRWSGIGELGHQSGITFGFNAHSNVVTNCSLHDENVLQDQTHIGINFTSNSNNNTLVNCGSYYFGAAVAAHSEAGANIAPNVVMSSELGGSAGNSGFQNTILDASNTDSPGTPAKSSIALIGNLNQIGGNAAMTIMGDIRSVTLVGNAMNGTTLYCQNDTASSVLTGAGNTFAPNNQNCSPFATSPATNNIKIQPTTTNTVLLTNQNCGNAILSSAAGGTLPVILPATPVTGCEITFRPNTNAITVDPNGNTIATNNTSQTSIFTFAASMNGTAVLHYDPSTVRWRLIGGDPATIAADQLGFGQNVAHGQVYMSCKATCSGGTGQIQVCPYNGSGGLILGGSLYNLPGCSFLDNSVFSAVTSQLRYIYAFSQTQAVTSSAGSGGHLQMTLNSTGGFNSGDPITCVNNGGTTAQSINVINDTNTTLSGSTITLTDVAYVSGSNTGSCSWIGLIGASTGHSTDANGVEIETGSGTRTLVGEVFIDGSHNLNATNTKQDVASWFNRQPARCVNTYTADRTTSSDSFAEPNSEIECEFVSWGAPATPGLGAPVTEWDIAGSASNGTASDGWAISAGFDSTSVAETAQTGSSNGGTTNLPFGLGGSKFLTEGKHFITLLAHRVTGGTVTITGGTGSDLVTSLEARPMQ